MENELARCCCLTYLSRACFTSCVSVSRYTLSFMSWLGHNERFYWILRKPYVITDNGTFMYSAILYLTLFVVTIESCVTVMLLIYRSGVLLQRKQYNSFECEIWLLFWWDETFCNAPRSIWCYVMLVSEKIILRHVLIWWLSDKRITSALRQIICQRWISDTSSVLGE